MPEIDNNQAAGAGNNAGENNQAGADQETDKKPASTDTGNEDAGKGADQGGEGAKDTSKGQNNAKAPTDASKGDDEDKDDLKEPPTRPRMSTQDFIIGRQKAKLAKQAKAGEGEDGGEDNKESEDDEIAPEDEALISKVVAKKFAPLLDKTIQAEDDKEVGDFLKDNPDFKPFEAQARRYMAHPSRRHLPVQTIFYEVAGNKLLKIGAERQRKADTEAKNTQTGGGSSRAGEGAKNVWDLSTEEFEAEKERVRQANRT